MLKIQLKMEIIKLDQMLQQKMPKTYINQI